jgi:hypothetical protein
MKIEDMSNEELVRSLMSFSWVAGSNDAEDKGNRYKPELLTRLDRGDRAVKAMGYLRSQLWIIVGECMMGASDRDKMQCIEKLLLDTEED